jgi:hypothetical protein
MGLRRRKSVAEIFSESEWNLPKNFMFSRLILKAVIG